jgi:hypothetical protein
MPENPIIFISLRRLYAANINPTSALAWCINFFVIMYEKPHCRLLQRLAVWLVADFKAISYQDTTNVETSYNP